jgi:hypothetical protein
MAAATTTLYAWADPAFVNGSPADHTWVTNFDNSKYAYPKIADVIAAKKFYWFCWGSYHQGKTTGNPTRALGSQRGSLAFANCLVAPNADSRTVPAARGTIFTYGVDGVCHQLADQVLYATGLGKVPPLTVSGAADMALARHLRDLRPSACSMGGENRKLRHLFESAFGIWHMDRAETSRRRPKPKRRYTDART